MMMKPAALTDAQIAEVEDRIIRGWVVRRDQWAALIAMAKERNVLVTMKTEAQSAMSTAHG